MRTNVIKRRSLYYFIWNPGWRGRQTLGKNLGYRGQSRFCLKEARKVCANLEKNVATVEQQFLEALSEFKALRAAVVEHALVAAQDEQAVIRSGNPMLNK